MEDEDLADLRDTISGLSVFQLCAVIDITATLLVKKLAQDGQPLTSNARHRALSHGYTVLASANALKVHS